MQPNINSNKSCFVYCCELAPGTVSLTNDRVRGDDSEYDTERAEIATDLRHCYSHLVKGGQVG